MEAPRGRRSCALARSISSKNYLKQEASHSILSGICRQKSALNFDGT